MTKTITHISRILKIEHITKLNLTITMNANVRKDDSWIG